MTAPCVRGRSRGLLPMLLLGSLSLAGSGDAATGQEWTRLRGPAGQGVGEADLPLSLAESNVRWRVDVGGSGHSSPVLWADRLFLTRVADAAKGGRREVVCFDAASGETLWARPFAFEPHEQHQLNSFASSTPAVDGQAVYVLWTSGPKLIALALDHAGEELWRRELGAFYSNHGSATSPIVYGDLVVVANEHQGEDCFVTALDRSSGATRWRIERQAKARWACYSPPFVYRPKTGEPLLLLASFAHGLTAIEPATGAIRWQANPGFENRFIAAPSHCDNLLLVNTGSGDSGKECVVFELDEAAKAEPKIRYRPRRGLPYVPSTIALDGRFFLFADGGFASCLDAKSGDELWRERIDHRFFSSPVSNGKAIYLGDRDGVLLTLALDRHEILGSFDLGSPICATPALARGSMFVRTAEHLICLARGDGD